MYPVAPAFTASSTSRCSPLADQDQDPRAAGYLGVQAAGDVDAGGITGSWRSSTTTSGRTEAAMRSAWAPSPMVATTSNTGLA